MIRGLPIATLQVLTEGELGVITSRSRVAMTGYLARGQIHLPNSEHHADGLLEAALCYNASHRLQSANPDFLHNLYIAKVHCDPLCVQKTSRESM